MPRTKRWKATDDFQQYVLVLEELYGIYVQFTFDPKGTNAPSTQRLVVRAFWKEDATGIHGLAASGDYEIAMYPDEKMVKTLIHALIRFTYDVLEAKLSALVPSDFRPNRRA